MEIGFHHLRQRCQCVTEAIEYFIVMPVERSLECGLGDSVH
jgi:hypothetical protein